MSSVTQMYSAKQEIITKEMKEVANKEFMSAKQILELVKLGQVVIPANHNHYSLEPQGIGAGLRTKVNVNIGISEDCNDYDLEMKKAEHLRLPDLNDVREGIIATKIAAHAADISKGLLGARDVDNIMSNARCRLDWHAMINLVIDSEKAKEYYTNVFSMSKDKCSMCGRMCAMNTTNQILNGSIVVF